MHIFSLNSLNVQEDDDACDVVDRRVLFLPSLEGLSYQRFSRLLGAVVLVVRHNDIHCLVVRDELPDAVTRQYHELVSL